MSWLASTLASPAHFGWRLLWLIGLPTGLLLIGVNYWIPESPRYLLERGRDEQARAVMRRYGAVLIDSVPEVTAHQKLATGSRDLFKRPFLGLTAAIGMVPMAAALIALVPSGLETRHKRLEEITAEELSILPVMPSVALEDG